MNKAIKAKGLSKQAKVQVLHMDDYFGDGNAYTSKPVTFGSFMEELADDLEMELQKDGVTAVWEDEDGEEQKSNLLAEWYMGSGDGNENYVLLTIVDGKIMTVVE
jgi:hypothetical protein